MRQGRALLSLQIVPETPAVLSAGEHTGWNRSPQSKRAPPAGMPLGVLIRPGRRAGHAIGPSGDRHRHPVVLITRCYCVHPLSFLEPGGRLFDLFDVAGAAKKAALDGLPFALDIFKFELSAHSSFSRNAIYSGSVRSCSVRPTL